jgi:microcystin degradation protein MlrC
MAARRILFAGLFHETHCFTPDVTGLDLFKVERGDAIIADRRGDGSQIDGFIEVADREGWDVIAAANYTATPSGIVADEVVDAFWRDVEPVARRAGAAGVDAIYLSLHGAMVSQSIEDVEGWVLQRLRAIPGLETVPLFGVFDLHANFTGEMARYANGLVCYRENPHIDTRDSGKRAAQLLARCLASGELPRMRHRNPPIVWPPTGTGTADTPMRDLESLARQLEQEFPALWAVNVVAGFSFADAREAGVSLSVVGTDDEAATAALDRLAALARELRHEGLRRERTPDDVLAEILPIVDGPVVMVEPSDNIGGGAPGNGTSLLRAFIAHRVEDAVVIIADAEAVAALAETAIGATQRLAIGGRDNPLDPGPLTLEVTLVSRSDGRFDLEDLNSHLVASQGRHIAMGPCAVVRHAGITILLTSRKTPPFDLGQLRSQGIVPERMKLIAVKAAVAHRRAYDPIAKASFTVTTPGPCTSDPTALPYRRLRRPIFPLDPV